jgi:hypothetical protein
VSGVSGAPEPGAASVVLWLEDQRRELPLAAAAGLLDLLRAAGIPYRLRRRVWQDPALGDEALLEAVGALHGPLEIVHNGQLAPRGVAHLRIAPGDEVVIGRPAHLRQRFVFFR